jgi:TrpR family transcriptional regulator, trp operon repressor
MVIDNVSWRKLITILSEAKSKSEMSALCDFLFTAEERQKLEKRVLLTSALIDANMSQRDVAKSIGVSISTVTRCSNALKRVDGNLKGKFK